MVSDALMVHIIYLSFRFHPGHLVIFYTLDVSMMWGREVNRSISLHTAADIRLFYWIIFVSPIFKAVSQYVLMRLLYERYLDAIL